MFSKIKLSLSMFLVLTCVSAGSPAEAGKSFLPEKNSGGRKKPKVERYKNKSDSERAKKKAKRRTLIEKTRKRNQITESKLPPGRYRRSLGGSVSIARTALRAITAEDKNLAVNPVAREDLLWAVCGGPAANDACRAWHAINWDLVPEQAVDLGTPFHRRKDLSAIGDSAQVHSDPFDVIGSLLADSASGLRSAGFRPAGPAWSAHRPAGTLRPVGACHPEPIANPSSAAAGAPEPSSLALVTAGLLSLVFVGRGRRRRD